MAKAGELIVEVKGDTTGLQRSLADADRSVTTFARTSSIGIGGIVPTIDVANLAMKGLGFAVDRVADAFAAAKSVGQFAINTAGDFQQLRISFETMLGSADKAGTMLRDISDFARKTPFDLPQVAEGSKRLLAYNIDAEKLLPTFEALGNIAAGVGRDKLPQLILAFGQVKAATKLTGAELRQFTEAGVPLLQILAEQSGKTAAQVKEDMEGGVAPSFEDVEKALFSMSAEGGKFFNLMEKQSTTFQGTMSNLKDGMIRFALSLAGVSAEGDILAGGPMEKIIQKAQALLGWVDANEGKIKEWSLAIGTAFADAITKFESEFGPAITSFFNEVMPKIPAFIEGVSSAVQFAIGAIDDMINAGNKVKQFFGGAFFNQVFGGNTQQIVKDLESIRGMQYSGGSPLQQYGPPNPNQLQKTLFGRASGGAIPGVGPVPITAHGGEMILNKSQQAQLFNMAKGNTNGKPVTINITGPIQMASDMDVDRFAERLGRQLQYAQMGV